jgi:hypothetical protein
MIFLIIDISCQIFYAPRRSSALKGGWSSNTKTSKQGVLIQFVMSYMEV